MKAHRQFSAVVEKEDDWYVALCPEVDVASQGKSFEEAVANLKEAVELYLEDEDVKKEMAGRKFSSPIITTFML